jgi:hypothetical protein
MICRTNQAHGLRCIGREELANAVEKHRTNSGQSALSPVTSFENTLMEDVDSLQAEFPLPSLQHGALEPG